MNKYFDIYRIFVDFLKQYARTITLAATLGMILRTLI